MIAVVGAGVVGKRVVSALSSTTSVVVYDEQKEVAEAAVDTHPDAAVCVDVASLGEAAVAVLAHQNPHSDLAATLVAAGVRVISVVGDVGDVRQLIELDELARQHDTTVIPGAGMNPGLAALLARWLSDSLPVVDEIHVAMHGTAGPACAREHHRALGGRALGWYEDQWIERPAGSGRELCWFPEPVGAYDCYRADVVDPIVLHAVFPTADRISARVSATRRDRLTARLPMLRPPHPEGGVGALRVEVRGADDTGRRVTLVAGIAEQVGRAAAATAAAYALHALRDDVDRGVVLPGTEGCPTAELLMAVERFGVRIQSFTGTA